MRILFLPLLLLAVLPLAARPLQDSVVTVSIKAVPGLQFDLVRFQVRPGARVRLTLTNADDMDHNLLITKPGTRQEVVQAALKLGEQGPKVDFIPASPQVLWAIPVVGPEQSRSITFTAPREAGVYPYVCTYPGHGFVMFGAMYVMAQGQLPPLAADSHVPPGRAERAGAAPAHAGHPGTPAKPARPLHPYTPVPPYLYRVFIAGASPAAIAVNLPHNLSYCWDAGTCRLRYAWQGGFLDNADLWKGKGDAEAKVVGEIFYRDKTAYPLRLEKPEAVPAVEYKGYRLVDRYPEFCYTVDGTLVYELLKPKADGQGLVRTFRIPKARKTVWFCVDAADGVSYEASAGQWQDGKLQLSARQAREFTLTMTPREGAKL